CFDWKQKISIRNKSSTADINQPDDPRSEGILLHSILSEIIQWQDCAVILEKYHSSSQITKKTFLQFKNVLDRLWQQDDIKYWFNGEGKVRTEVLVLPKSGDWKRLDRVVIKGKDATVIDFKSGKPKNSDVIQVREYVDLVSEMGYQTEGYLLYLEDARLLKI
ncbi:MAG: hypothetical protein AAF789_12055, partial [Bacteroidota bacterium]